MKKGKLTVLVLGCTYLNLFGDISIDHLEKSFNLPRPILSMIIENLESFEKYQQGRWGSYHHILPNLINKYSLKRGCEVGVSGGFHSVKILKDTAVEKLYSIDPYAFYGDKTNYDGLAQYEQQTLDIFYLRVKERLSIFANRSELIRDYSTNAAKLIENNSLDFVFIDANHEYEFVLEDLTIWYNKIRPGGIISGDDYVHSLSVKKAVDEFFNRKNLTVSLDKKQPRFWWVIKP